jgi:hypothetical protein
MADTTHTMSETRATSAFDIFCQLLKGQAELAHQRSHQPFLIILPLGDFACGLHSGSGDDVIECVAFGNIRKELFIEIIWERILNAGDEVALKPYAVSGDQVVLEIDGFTFEMQYLECKTLVNS